MDAGADTCASSAAFPHPADRSGSGHKSQHSSPRHQRANSFNGRAPPPPPSLGALPNSRSMPVAGGGGGGGGGQRMQQLPGGRAPAHHRRSASSSSMPGDAAPAGLQAFQVTAVGGQQWAHSGLNWCPEPYGTCQPASFMPLGALQPVQQFVARPVAPPGQQRQRARQQSGELSSDALNALAWQQAHGRSYQQAYAHGGGGGGHAGGSRYGARASAGYGPGSAPASAMSSPVLERSRQRGASSSTPPPPPLALPVLELQVGCAGGRGWASWRGPDLHIVCLLPSRCDAFTRTQTCAPTLPRSPLHPACPHLPALHSCSSLQTPARMLPIWSASSRRPRRRWRCRPAARKTSLWCAPLCCGCLCGAPLGAAGGSAAACAPGSSAACHASWLTGLTQSPNPHPRPCPAGRPVALV